MPPNNDQNVVAETMSICRVSSLSKVDSIKEKFISVQLRERNTRKYPTMVNIFSFFLWIIMFPSCHSLCFPVANDIVINYSSSSLSTVPKNLPNLSQILDLSQNNITEIHLQDFVPLHQLKYLNLSSNKISNLAPALFKSNQKLECLDLSKNQLSNIECHFLYNATSLKYLDISENNFLSLTLGKAFSFLQDLEYLSLGSRKTIKFQKDDLKEISGKQLEEVSIKIKLLSEYGHSALTILRTAKLHVVLPSIKNFNFLKDILDDAFNTSYILTLSNIECCQNCNQLLSVDCCEVCSKRRNIINQCCSDCSRYIESFKVLGNFSRVQNLSLQHLKVDWETSTQILKIIWDSSVENLSISNMKICQVRQPLSWFHFQKELRTFTLRQIEFLPFYFNQANIYDVFEDLKVENLAIYESGMIFLTCPKEGNTYKLIDISDNSFTSDFFLQNCNTLKSLETFILKQNRFGQLFKVSNMTTYMTSLKHLDVSQNQLIFDEIRVCPWTNSLIKLNLSSNRLTDSVFTCLPSNLEILDLQKNSIYTVPKVLKDLNNLKELYLGANKLANPPDCSKFRNLEILFVEANSFHEPSSIFLQSCQRLTVLNAASNPFTCTCNLRDFSTMNKNTQIEMIGWPKSYRCAYPDILKGTLLKDFHLSEVTCSTTLLLVIVLGTMFVFVILIGLMCHFLDLPWYLRMIWQWTQMKQRTMKTDSYQLSENLVYHAFVSYSQHDYNWVKEQLLSNLEERNLRICHHERDFIPGKGIIENIINCIEKSYKSIFVLSPNFIQSEWCHYELYFAQHQVLSEQTENLILIVLEPIPQYLIPSKYYKLKSLMAKKTYLEWPNDKNKQRLFWANLQAAIGISLTAP
ncbi:toll-like receptor 1 isoform X2 [Chiloscyllium plagiosum]|uniref:toll-like receptor 1 isoform X2 n=1 Tax=Chiloscyllium plagiosum TaxID=36176 RepID=UPI001CB84285|nr:toll-like receptor 1 isoform X2 [Chiloscyllium plagiosum]